MSNRNPTSKDINDIVDRLDTLHISTKELLRNKNVNCVGQRDNFINDLNTFHRQLSVIITHSSEFTPSFISCVKQIHLLVIEVIKVNEVIGQWEIAINNNDRNALLEQISKEFPEASMEKTMLDKLELYTTRLHELSISIQNLEKELISPHR